MFVGGLAFLVAAVSLLWMYFTEESSWVVFVVGLFFLACAIDMFVFVFTHKRLINIDLRRKEKATRFQFHTFGEPPLEYSKAGYIVENVDDLIDLIFAMKDIEVTRANLLIQTIPGAVRSDGLDPRTVTVNGYGLIGTLSRPLTA